MGDRDARLAPADTLLANLPEVNLNEHEAERVCMARRFAGKVRQGSDSASSAPTVFLGLGEVSADGWLNPRRLVAVATTRKSTEIC